MSADKTVGGRTREEVVSLLADLVGSDRWPLRKATALNREIDAWLDAVFSDSRGLREGLERGAEKFDYLAVSVTLTRLIREHLQHCLRTIRDVDCPDLTAIVVEWARKIARAEASKLGGEEEPYTLTKAVAEAALDVTRPFREARAAPRRPDPPAEERKLPLGHEYRPHNNGHDYCVHRVTDGYVAGSYRDCRQPRSAHEQKG
jgi:hypothetical protein